MNPPVLLDASGLWIVAAYLGLLVAIGVAARLARRDTSLADFYLGGRRMGVLVLFLTLYASQYSGLTLVGFAGGAYRQGFSFLVSVSFGCSILAGYLIIAPRLQRLSAQRGFVTVGDFVQDRYGSRKLTSLCTLVFVFALSAYILSNLKAMGYVVHSATAGRVGAAEGIVGLALLMVVYETLGGMRAVAWTDVVQGTILLLGCMVIFVAVGEHYGGLAQHTALLAEQAPGLWAPPDSAGKLRWVSTLVLVCFGVSIYPHAIQRIYAARDARVLKRSLQLMLLMPFLTTLPILLVGIIGAVRFPGLDRNGSEQIVLTVLTDLVAARPQLAPLIVLLICALVAAIMSTVDSALLAVSSLLTEDLYRPMTGIRDEKRLTYVGKLSSWLLMALLTYLALVLPQTLWRLTEIKLEVLVQAAPAIFLGLHRPRLMAGPVLAGLAVGLLLTLALLLGHMLSDGVPARPLGIHAGVWGLLANLATLTAGHRSGVAARA